MLRPPRNLPGRPRLVASVFRSPCLRRRDANTAHCAVDVAAIAASASAQGRGGGAGGADPAAQAARQAAANKPRTIDGINTVWIEELTQPEFRDMIKDGYTTVLIMTGGVENNDGNLQMNKHMITQATYHRFNTIISE